MIAIAGLTWLTFLTEPMGTRPEGDIDYNENLENFGNSTAWFHTKRG